MNAIIGIKPGDKLYWMRPDSFGKTIMSLVEVVDVKPNEVIIRYAVGAGPYKKFRVKTVLPETLSFKAGTD